MAKALGICAAVSDGGNALTIHGELIYDEGLPLEDCIRTLSEIDSERFPFAVCPENKKMRVATSDLYLSRVKDRYYETVVDPSLISGRWTRSTRFSLPARRMIFLRFRFIRFRMSGSGRIIC